MRNITAVALAAALGLGACGSGSETAAPTTEPANAAAADGCATGTISGAGSTFVQPIVQQWIKDYGQRCPEATITYQGVGSGAGIQQLTSGTIDFAGSDVQMKADELAAAKATVGDVVQIPWSAGGIAVEMNLPGLTSVDLTPDAVAGIFTGAIKRWDDPVIAATNPNVKLPSLPVQVIHRSDGSGTTAAFTAFLAQAAPKTWTLGTGKEVDWSTGQGAKGSDGVTAVVKQTAGAVGYAEVSFARSAGLAVARVQNRAGAFTAPDAHAVSAGLESADAPTGYPISTATYLLVPRKLSAEKAALVSSFARYALGDGQRAADPLGYAPVPGQLAEEALTAIDELGGASSSAG
jgi:phosphate transport system substrate-binding protein